MLLGGRVGWSVYQGHVAALIVKDNDFCIRACFPHSPSISAPLVSHEFRVVIIACQV